MTRTRLTPFLLAVPMAMLAGWPPLRRRGRLLRVAPNTGCGGTLVPNLEQALDLADNATDPDRVFSARPPTWRRRQPASTTASRAPWSRSSVRTRRNDPHGPAVGLLRAAARRRSRLLRARPHDRAAPDRGGRAQGASPTSGLGRRIEADRGSDAGEQAPRRGAPERRHARGIERRAWERPGHDRGPPRERRVHGAALGGERAKVAVQSEHGGAIEQSRLTGIGSVASRPTAMRRPSARA